MVFPSPAAAESWRVRIIEPDNPQGPPGGLEPARRVVCGAGVLLTDRHVLTCAHVIARALRCDPGGPRPDGAVLVDFPVSLEIPPLRARVAEDGWARKRQDEGGDVAILVLDGPLPGVFPPPLARCGPPRRRRVRMFGHPAGLPGGLWVAGDLIGSGGQSPEWVQLDGRAAGQQIVPGYSGAGVLDEETGAVIGCIVAVYQPSERSGNAWMIPLETVAGYWPPLAGYLEDEASPRADEAAELTADEQQLAMSLAAVELIRDRRSRDLCVDQLTRRLRQPSPLRRYPGDVNDVRALARACLTVPGLMAELLDTLTQASGQTPELARLDALAAQLIPVPLLTRGERNDLYVQLGDVRLEGMELLYREAVGALGRPLRTRPGDFLAIVQQLEDASYGPHGVPPLLYFLRGVAERLPAAAGIRLRGWVTGVADRLHIAEGRIGEPATVPANPGGREHDEHFCVTDLTPDLLDPERYRITIWFQTSPDQELVIGGGDDELIGLPDVPAQLDAALSTLTPDLTGQRRSRTYEFILPRHLLGHAVNQWRTGPRQLPYRFSMASPVVVRSQDRLRDQQMREHWPSKWGWLRANGASAGPEAIYWLDNRMPISAESILSVLVEDEKPVCVVFRRPPEATQDPADDVVMAALAGGVPVMMWCRDPAIAELVQHEIARLLEGGGLAELPERVRHLRNQAIRMGDPAGHAGLSLTLLWDDADRIPRAYRAP